MFIGNVLKYNELVAWIGKHSEPEPELESESESICVVSGPTGCGKTFGIKAAIAASGKMLDVFDSTTCTNGKDFLEKFTKVTQSNVLAQFTQTSTNNRIVFIDELDALLAIDRTFLSNLKGLLRTVRVIIACSTEIAKRINIPHKHISLNAASETDIMLFLKSLNSGGGSRGRARASANAKVLVEAAETCNGNIGLALKYIPKMGNRDAFPEVGTVYRNTDNAYTIFAIDTWLNPLRFHENLLHEMKQRLQPRIKIQIYESLMYDLCIWDVLMTKDATGGGEFALNYISLNVKKLDKLQLKKLAAPSQTEFTRLINMLSVRKKALNALYATHEFPWNEVGAYEKSFLHRK